MEPHTPRAPRARPQRQIGPRLPGAMPVLVAVSAFGTRLTSAAVAHAIARGLQAGRLGAPELLELHGEQADAGELRVLLAEQHFDTRLHDARALLIAAAELCERTLARSAAFELASRARQGGVPAYAIAGTSTLGPFDARMLDLQLVLQARSARGLAAAARTVAGLLHTPTPASPTRTRRL